MRNGLAIAAGVALLMMPVFTGAAGPVLLAKVVSQKDEVVVGLPEGTSLEGLARRLREDGFVTLWQYAPGRGRDGGGGQQPQRQIVVMGQQVIRLEPFGGGEQAMPPPGAADAGAK